MRKKAGTEEPNDDGLQGWNSPVCTRSRCRKALDPGAGNQLVDENGDPQRYCWKCWVAYNADQKRFPEVIEKKSQEG
jgi:hypothetical protein